MRRVEFFSQNRRLVGVFHQVKNKEKAPVVITSHGLESYKDSDKYLRIAERFTIDFSVFRFDFSGCGESEGDMTEDLPNRIYDLIAAIDLMKKQPYVDPDRIGLLGSSMGGYLSILAANKEKIGAVVTWSAPYILELNLDGLDERSLASLKIDAINIIKKIKSPILLIHGDKDDIVPLSHAVELYKNANTPKELKIIKGADHRFLNVAYREEAINLSLDWFKRYL